MAKYFQGAMNTQAAIIAAELKEAAAAAAEFELAAERRKLYAAYSAAADHLAAATSMAAWKAAQAQAVEACRRWLAVLPVLSNGRRRDWRSADLRDTILFGDWRDADLRNADLRGAILYGTFGGANLTGANLEGIHVRGTSLWGALVDEDAVLQIHLGYSDGFELPF